MIHTPGRAPSAPTPHDESRTSLAGPRPASASPSAAPGASTDRPPRPGTTVAPSSNGSAPLAGPAPADHPDPVRYKVSRRWADLTKRGIDLLVGIPLCVAMVIVFPWVALAIKLTSRGPVLFRQVRIGRGGQPIVVYKFRSMHTDAEARLRADAELYEQYLANGFKVPSGLDPRTTLVGRFLRRTSLDELPQAVCLVRGSMSVVGPRPVVPDELRALYGDDPSPYLACKPGLTGLWQVSGRSRVVHDERARLDAEYAREWSLRTDLEILVRTIPVVLSADGAH